MWGAGLSLESWKIAEAESFPCHEGNMCIVAMRDDDAPPGSKAASRMEGNLRNMEARSGPPDWSPAGDSSKAQPELGSELRSGVGPAHSTNEAAEGNERAEGRGRPEGSPREKAKVRTQSRVALPPNLARVNAAAKRAAQTRFTALLHHVDVSRSGTSVPVDRSGRRARESMG